jgi:hypothetical protein
VEEKMLAAIFPLETEGPAASEDWEAGAIASPIFDIQANIFTSVETLSPLNCVFTSN